MPDCIALRDCVEDPVTKGCEKFCAHLAIKNSTIEEKRLILGYREETIDAILKAYNDDDTYINSFEDLAKWLTPAQEEEILTKFRQMNTFRLRYFQLSRIERDTVINAIQNLGLNMNDELGTPLPV